MTKKEIIIKIFLIVACLVGIMFLARYFYLDNQIEYKDLSKKQAQEEVEKEEKQDNPVFSKAVPKSEEEILEDNRTSQTKDEIEKPKEVTDANQRDNISFGSTGEVEINNEINQEQAKDNLIIVPVRYTSSDGRLYVEYNNNIYEVSGISEKYLPIRKVAKGEINNYPIVYYDETKDMYFIYTDISEIKFLKINEKYLDETTKTYKGKVEEFIL